MPTKKQLCLVLFLLLSSFTFSNEILRHLTNAEGLSNNSVNCIFEDSDNTIWIGTWDGLNAFNGRDVKTYRYSRSKNSITNNVIRQVIEQKEGVIWISTDHGINRFDKKTQTFTNYYLTAENNTPKQERSFIINKTKDGAIICFVKGAGLFHYNEVKNTFIKFGEGTKIKDLVSDQNENLYVLDQDNNIALYKINYHSTDSTSSSLSLSYSSTKNINRLFISEGKLLFQEDALINIMSNGSLTIEHSIPLQERKTASQLFITDQIVYISYLEGGCTTYNLRTKEEQKINLIPENTSIFSMYLGSQDILWVGTDGQGVSIIHKDTAPFSTISSSFPVRCFEELDTQHILVGTKGGGLKIFDKENSSLDNFYNTKNGLISNSVYSIIKNQRGDFFIGTEGEGINIINQHTKRLEKLVFSHSNLIPRAIYNLYFSHEDSILWVGTSGNGLYKIELEYINQQYRTKNIKQFSSSSSSNIISNDVVYSIIENKETQELICGTRGGGLIFIDLKSDNIKESPISSEGTHLIDNDILSIQNTKSGLWVGTSYGLNNLSISEGKYKTQQFIQKEQLGDITIHGILEDESGSIWVSTNNGLFIINLDEQQVENYTFKDGLQSNEFSDGAYFKDKDGFLYFGGIAGFNRFRKEELVKRDFNPTLSLSGLRIYNTNVEIHDFVENQILKLDYDERYLSLSFVTNDFIDNENCEYAYRLLDYSGQWIENGSNPTIVFSKLPPGKYKLEVRYTNGNKVWSKETYKLGIEVAYPWWLSGPAILAYLILFSIIVYVVQAIIKGRIRLNRQIMIEQIEKQHQQREHESKLNFFTNVAHEFFTPLTLIYGPAEHLLERRNLDSYSRRYIQIIKNNVERMQKLITELMEFRKAKSGYTSIYLEDINVQLLMNYISDNYMDMSEVNSIDFKVVVDEVSTLHSDREILEKILFNLFSNAFKYTPARGYIYVKVWQDEETNTLNLKIKNSGKGLSERQMNEIFDKFKIFDTPQQQNALSTGIGLNFTRSLVELLGGEINVASDNGSYVEFSLQIPPVEKQTSEQVEEIQEEVNPQKVTTAPSRNDVTILIVEDEQNIRELLKDILAVASYHILEAEDGKEALKIVEQNLPDIIISDILMPNIDGISLINKLRADNKTMHIPIITISAKNAIEDQIKAYEHGSDMYITKPFHPRHILSTVENLLEKQSILKDYFRSSISSVTLVDGVEMHKEDEILLVDIVNFVEKNIEDEKLNPNAIAEFLGISKASLYRKLKDLTNKTPSEFVRSIRLEHSAQLLKSTKLTVLEVMYKSGFSNKSYFYREFAKQYDMSPKEYRDSLTKN